MTKTQAARFLRTLIAATEPSPKEIIIKEIGNDTDEEQGFADSEAS